mgnify:CR=1 FL=1
MSCSSHLKLIRLNIRAAIYEGKIQVMSVRQRRLEKGWSQEQLSEVSGISVRTVQRIEQGQKAGLESLKCLAAVFELNISDLIKEETMNDSSATKMNSDNREEEEAIEYVKNLKGFHKSWMSYIVVISCLYVLNLYVSPDYFWVIWPALGWGIGIVIRGIKLFGMFNFFGHEWEQKQFEKRINRGKFR